MILQFAFGIGKREFSEVTRNFQHSLILTELGILNHIGTPKSLLLPDVFYIHRASVWGVRIQDNYIVTGSMDGTIAVIDAETLNIKKHFVAHENEWGSKYK